MLHPSVVPFAFAIVLACVPATEQDPSPSPSPPAPDVAPGQPLLLVEEESRDPASDLECRTTCSDVKPRTPLIEVSWDPVKDERMKNRRPNDEQRLEVAVSKAGFASGEFTALPVAGGAHKVMPGAGFIPGPAYGTAQKKLPPQLELRVVDAEAVRGFTKAPPHKFVVRAEGTEPGVLYLLRVSTRVGADVIVTKTVRCQAPVCPFDDFVKPDGDR